MGLRRRALTFLFLPILVFVFMVGWVCYYIGKQQDRGSLENRSIVRQGADAEDENLEVGLIEDIIEKQLS